MALKGLRTVAVGLGVAVAPVASEYLMSVDWSAFMSPTWAFFVSGVIMVAMRFVTNTPLGKDK